MAHSLGRLACKQPSVTKQKMTVRDGSVGPSRTSRTDGKILCAEPANRAAAPLTPRHLYYNKRSVASPRIQWFDAMADA